jgi:hypothetical protein
MCANKRSVSIATSVSLATVLPLAHAEVPITSIQGTIVKPIK